MTEVETAQPGVDPSLDPGTWLASFRRDAERGHRLYLLAEPRSWRPTMAESESCQVLFDGILQDRERLQERFEGDSDSATDAELVLQGYLRWGEDVVQHIKGVFSLLVLDKNQDALLCARDPFGIYPLFYAEGERELLFSPCIDALLSNPGVSSEINRAVLAEHLCDRFLDPGGTYYTAVRRVVQGHIMRVTDSGYRQTLYWRFPQPAPPDTKIQQADIDEFDCLLDQAVDRFMGLGQAGIWLSGGIDSGTVATVAAENRRAHGAPPPMALSLDFHDVALDEVQIQREVAQRLGMPSIMLPIEKAVPSGDLVAEGLALIPTLQAPGVGLWNAAYQTLQREARQRGCRIILTGVGGDEWQVDSDNYISQILQTGDFARFYRRWRTTVRSSQISEIDGLRHVLWGYGLHPLLKQSVRHAVLRTLPGVMHARWRRSHERTTPEWVAPDPALRAELASRAEQRWSRATQPDPYDVIRDALGSDNSLHSMSMEQLYESSRCLGMRTLHPLHDVDLATFLWQAPTELLNLGGMKKGLARRRLVRQFPDLGFERQRKESAVPYAGPYLRQYGAKAWARMGGVRALADLGIVDGPAVEQQVRDIIAADDNRSPHLLWVILSLEAWTKARYNSNLK